MNSLTFTFSPSKLKFSASNITKISFFAYIFFVIFGNSLPFKEKITNIEDITTSNPVSQLVFSFLYILSFCALLGKKEQLFRLIKAEKFLTLFLFWTLCTVFWSESFFVSLKRWIQIFGSVIICTSVLLNLSSSDQVLRYFRAILIIYLPLTLLSVIFIPGAVQWEFPAWRGLAPHKNYLGQIALVSVILWTFTTFDQNFRKKIYPMLFLGLSFVVYIGARSTTCLLVGSLLLTLLILKNFGKLLGPPGVDKFFLLTSVTSLGLIAFFITFLAPDLIVSFFHFLGKDLTFTGRLDLWERIFEISKQHLLFGCGFGGFWVMNSPSLDFIFNEFTWLPNTAHMGYLDLLNETGLMGIFLFTLMVIFYIKDSIKVNRSAVWQWFFISALLLNLQETTLFLQNHLTAVFFILAYLSLYADLIKQKSRNVVLNKSNGFVKPLYYKNIDSQIN